MFCEFPVRQKSKGTGDVLWLKTVLVSGTLNDKVAARTLLIQESPVHNLSSVSSLLSMATKKAKRESILATGSVTSTQSPIFFGLAYVFADTLKELWVSDLLPEERKLKSLKQVIPMWLL